ncbi:GcrA family cell cycle regulator [Futiania mangrovi]|uniref:GcrA cell cycle regulator n=1 Tax=Futiania mangrovi TaxID=2959716 RepID=A0A9J6P8W1_9PROT|nr:GcrA family cell cycle regulator [Futiania mangrovii]MCP1336228.1 GcrA cell cycle regulator [Futiania mangrovii]
MAWTEERVALLKKLWAEGWSASQIARELGEVTRNAVIGKVHRLGIARRDAAPRPSRPEARTSAARKPATASKSEARARTAEAAPARPAARTQTARPVAAKPVIPTRYEVVERGKPLSLMELNDRTCKWPIGNPGDADFSFCGESVVSGHPYCQEHLLRAYQPASTRRDRDRGRDETPALPNA